MFRGILGIILACAIHFSLESTGVVASSELPLSTSKDLRKENEQRHLPGKKANDEFRAAKKRSGIFGEGITSQVKEQLLIAGLQAAQYTVEFLQESGLSNNLNEAQSAQLYSVTQQIEALSKSGEGTSPVSAPKATQIADILAPLFDILSNLGIENPEMLIILRVLSTLLDMSIAYVIYPYIHGPKAPAVKALPPKARF